MAVILDILGSFIIRAAIVIVILNLMINLHQELSKNTDRISLNESINGASQVIDSDIKLAGFRAAKDFAIAQSNEISFSYGDTALSNLSIYTIRYYINPTAPAKAHKILYRTVNGASQLEIARDVVTFNIAYYKVDGTVVSYGINVSGIKSIYVTLVMESSMTERTYQGPLGDTLALQAKWERHFFPENL
jgi:hypothetical protein